MVRSNKRKFQEISKATASDRSYNLRGKNIHIFYSVLKLFLTQKTKGAPPSALSRRIYRSSSLKNNIKFAYIL